MKICGGSGFLCAPQKTQTQYSIFIHRTYAHVTYFSCLNELHFALKLFSVRILFYILNKARKIDNFDLFFILFLNFVMLYKLQNYKTNINPVS